MLAIGGQAAGKYTLLSSGPGGLEGGDRARERAGEEVPDDQAAEQVEGEVLRVTVAGHRRGRPEQDPEDQAEDDAAWRPG